MTRENKPVTRSSYRVREAALKVLVRVEKDRSFVNLALPAYLKHLDIQDRPLATRIAYGTVQRLNTLDWALEQFLKKELLKFTPWIRNLLRSGAYQLWYLDQVPAPLVVDVSVRLAYRYGHRGVASLINAVLRKCSREKGSLPWPEYYHDTVSYISLVHSHPRWLVQRWVDRMGIQEAEAMCKANNRIPSVSLRVNKLAGEKKYVKEFLEREGLQVEDASSLPVALRAQSDKPLADLTSFKRGLFTVQGEASMHCGYLLSPPSGSRAVDVCSAPGGKATHLAELMLNTGKVEAGEINSRRLRLVEKNAQRLGLNNIQTSLWDGREVYRHVKTADRVLCDVPCSGLGVISFKPDLKWFKSEADLASLNGLQADLLAASSRIVKPGGKLLYAVCSLEPEETQEIVTDFLKKHPYFVPSEIPDFPFEGEQLSTGVLAFYPHRHLREGFYMALLERKI